MSNYPIGVSLEEAFEMMMIHSSIVEIEKINSKDAWQRVLAVDVVAGENVPPFDKSPYDGYALRSEDTKTASKEYPLTFDVIEEIPAGHAPQKVVTRGCAAKILTGAPIPEGADVVIPYERTQFDENNVTIFNPLKAGSNIVRAGEDIAKGDVVIKKGTMITPAVMAQAAGLGYNYLDVYRQIKAGILCTGGELVRADEALTPGKIRNTNDHMLTGYLQEAGIIPVDMGTLGDDVEAIADSLKEYIQQCDCVITTGGASVGDYDVMKEAIEQAGGTVLFWKIRIKPGSAIVGGILCGRPIFALSGNPGAAAVTLQLLVLPILRRMMGLRAFYPQRLQVKILDDFFKASPNRRMLRGHMIVKNGEAYFVASNKQSNGMTSAMRECTLLAEIPAGTVQVTEGTIVFAYDLEHFSEK